LLLWKENQFDKLQLVKHWKTSLQGRVQMNVVVDVDDVCAQLSTEWIKLHNMMYVKQLKIEDIHDWNISLFTENGKEAFNYFEMPELYNHMPPVEGALEGVNCLRSMGHRVIFVTASTVGTFGRKYKWLNDNGFNVARRDYAEVFDKNLIRAEAIIDDNYMNVKSFNGLQVLFSRPWNLRYNHHPRANNWLEVIKIIKNYIQ
jgi:5'(3')-deoxyribonucleotidase